MIICKDCRCFNPVTVSDRYCGECVIGDTRNPIEINAEITGCCLFEPKQPNKQKQLTYADRIRQMTDEELAVLLVKYLIRGAIQANGIVDMERAKSIEEDTINSVCGKKDIETMLNMLKQEI